MSFWNAVVLIFMIGSIAWLRSKKYSSTQALPGSTLPSNEAELEREIIELRKRIAVLERIATDDKKESDLVRQIEALRD